MSIDEQRVEIEDIYPLTPLQRGLLFHALYAPDSKAYFGQLSCTFRGDLNVVAFQRAWQRVIDRHAVFRTAFLWEDLDEPVQVVARSVELPFAQHDWRALSQAEQSARWAAFLAQEHGHGFDFTTAPLARLTLIRFADDHYRFLWSSHHLLLDGWSGSLVMKEVFTSYSAFARNQVIAQERPPSYREYISWLQRQDLAAAETFWRRFLAGVSAPTPLGIDHAPHADQPERYAEQHLRIAESTSATLQSLARRHGLTMSTLFQGVWALLLSRYSATNDVVFGITVSGRPPDLIGVETMVGLFINSLPMRVQVRADALVFSWLQVLQDQQAELRQYEYSPLVQVQGWSAVPRRLPLFESLVVFENYPVADAVQQQASSLTIHDLATEEWTNYPLTIGAMSGPVLAMRFTYDCRRFDATAISRLLGHLQELLTNIAANPRQRLAALAILSAAERQQLLGDWNATATPARADRCLHQLVAEQAARSPDRVALAQGDAHLSYHALNARANQLAHHLQALGVGPEVLGALCVERSLELVVGVLGLLKAGGAYLSLDPTYPKERLAHMIADSQAPVLISQEHLAGELPSSWLPVVCLDSDWADIANACTTEPTSAVQLDNLAYVIYTSGSTGTPKGVQATQRGLVNLAQAQIAAFAIGPDSRVLQFASPSFDAAVSELATALLAGATLCMPPADLLLAGLGLVQLMQQHAITTATLPPTVLATLPNTPLRMLRTIITAGEACPAALVTSWARDRRMLNAYGPTEATVCATIGVGNGDADGHDPPLGRPIANTQIYLLDAWLHPAPIGIAGEIYIGGTGITRGYLGRPDLTAERFVPNPFVEREDNGTRRQGDQERPQSAICNLQSAIGTRLYKTGDLARYTADGNLEFLGRLDQQVKLRGFRIEPGEIEAVLRQHPALCAAVVVARADQSGDKRLVAYVVTTKDERRKTKDESRDAISCVSTTDLRAFLRSRLPDYMLPAAFVTLDALPLTPNGKVDRRALPALDQAAVQDTYVAPRDAVELQLVHIWEDLLGVRPIGVTDNFFDIGGHSLLAMGLMVHIQQQFGPDLPLATLFQGPTIAELAVNLRQRPDVLPWSPLVQIQRGAAKPPLFCVHPAGGNVLCYIELARQLGPDQAVYGLQARGLAAEHAPFTCIEDMAAYYVDAVQTVQPRGPYRLAGWSSGGIVAFEMAQQLYRQGQEVSLLALLDTMPPPPSAADQPDRDDTDIIVLAIGSENLPMPLEAFRQLDLDEQLRYALDWARKTNLVPPDAGLPQTRRLLQLYQANVRAVGSYVPQVYPGRITLFKSQLPVAGAVVPELVLDQSDADGIDDMTFGWGALSTQPVELHIAAGTHMTMIFEPHAQRLAAQLQGYLSMKRET